MDPINTALNHFTSMGLSGPEAQALVNQGLTAYNQMQPSRMSYGGRAGYADGGLGSLMQAPQDAQQAASGQMDPQQAVQIIIQMLVDNGVPPEIAKKLAIQMLHIFMQGGEPALESFANDLEKQEAMAHGGIAGYAPRQGYFLGGIGRAIGSVVGGIGKAVSGVVKGVANAVKSVVKSDIGKLALLAGGAYLMMNPAALSGIFGTTAATAGAEGGLGIVGADIAGPGSYAYAAPGAATTLGGAATTVVPNTGPGLTSLEPAYGSSTAAQIERANALSNLANTSGQTMIQQGINQPQTFLSKAWDYGKSLGQDAYKYVQDNPFRTAFDVANLAGLYSNYGKQPTPTSPGTQRRGQVEPYLRASAQRLHPEWTQQQVDQYVQQNLSEYAAQGGIMGYRKGYEDAGVVEMASEPSGAGELDDLAKDLFGMGWNQLDEKQQEQLQDWIKSRKPSAEQQPVFNQMASSDAYIKLVEHYMSLGYTYEQASDLAYKHFSTGEEQEPSTPGDFRNYKKVATGGFIPPARKAGGIMELDARDTGGFIPYGKKERHDDVPAVLAKNEFVFTSKAVRNAGGGDIKKGAKRMYTLMRQLEGKRA